MRRPFFKLVGAPGLAKGPLKQLQETSRGDKQLIGALHFFSAPCESDGFLM